MTAKATNINPKQRESHSARFLASRQKSEVRKEVGVEQDRNKKRRTKKQKKSVVKTRGQTTERAERVRGTAIQLRESRDKRGEENYANAQ